MKRKIVLVLLGVVFLTLVAGCVWQSARDGMNKTCTRQIFAMDTVMSFTAYGKNCEEAVEAAIAEVKRLDALLSTGNPDSEVSRLNAQGKLTVSEDTAVLFEYARAVYEDTGGLFDVTVYPLMELWGFPTGKYHVPSAEELAEVLPLADGSQVELTGTSSADETMAESEEGRLSAGRPGTEPRGTQVSLGEGQRADLGGIAKGYTSARIMEIYQEYGVRSGMVSLGGNVQVLNRKPDGAKWRIGIRNPAGNEGELAAVLNIENRAVITSGGYERYFEENGNTYIHILDPRTGYPADGDLASVTVVSEDGTLADALSTALYIMGLEDALDYWMAQGDNFELALITEAGEIFVTEGLEDSIETEGKLTVVERGGERKLRNK